MISPPKLLDEIQPNLVCELLTWMGRATANSFWPRPLRPWGGGQKVKYHLISITKSISMIFIPNFVCILTNERYKTYQTGFSFCRLGHAPRVGLRGAWGAQGVKKDFQTWSCGISNRRGWRAEKNASKVFILGSNWWPWGEVKRSNIIKFQLPCQFQRFFIPNFMCVLTNELYKTYQTGFSFCRLGHGPWVGLRGAACSLK